MGETEYSVKKRKKNMIYGFTTANYAMHLTICNVCLFPEMLDYLLDECDIDQIELAPANRPT